MKMTPEAWDMVPNFDPAIDNFGNPLLMEVDLIFKIQNFRDRVGLGVIIHCGTNKEHSKTGEHYKGNAIDGHVKGKLDLLDIFVAAIRSGFMGIGLYPWGFHLDDRAGPLALWGSMNGKHQALTSVNIDILRAAYRIHY